MKISTIIAFLLTFQLCHAQTTWYVSNSGLNSNSGVLITEPFSDINHALSVASCGDSVYIIYGTYHEKIQATSICPDNNRIVIQGDISQKPLIVGDSIASSKYAVSANGEGYYFRNLKMTSPYPALCSQSNQVIVGFGDHFTFDDIIVFNSGYDGIKTYGDCNTSNFAVNWKIINSEIFNCGLGCPTSVVNGDGIDFTECRDCIIDNCIIRDNQGHQIQMKLEAKNVTVKDSHIEGVHLFQIGLPGSVAQCDPSSYNADSISIIGNTILAKGDTSEFIFKLADVHNLRIQNNTIIKDSINNINIGFICFGGCAGGSAWSSYPTSPVEIKSNIFANYATSTFAYGADTTFFDPFDIASSQVSMNYNLFFDVNNQISNPIDNGINSIVADPLFCDYPLSYNLQGISPCIDSGDPSLPNDPDNSINDIGARYYQNVCTTNQIDNSELNPNPFSIYPNPFSDEFMIECLEITTLYVVDVHGRKLHEQDLAEGINVIDLSAFPKGVYFFRMIGENRKLINTVKGIKK